MSVNFQENMRRSREVLAAFWRQGLHELGAMFYGPGTIAQHPEYGMIGTKPPGLVTEGLRPDTDKKSSKDDPGPSILEERLRDAERGREGREPEPPEYERD